MIQHPYAVQPCGSEIGDNSFLLPLIRKPSSGGGYSKFQRKYPKNLQYCPVFNCQ